MMHNIPLFKVYMSDGVDAELLKVLHSGWIGEGEKVVEFEKTLSEYLHNPYINTLNSGTSGLHLAYHMILNPDGSNFVKEPDSEIITTAMTCTATNTSIVANGCKIVWADVDPVTGNIDTKSVSNCITEHTKAVVMVHWGGNPCKIDEINTIAHKHGIKTVEDGAHAMGMEYKGDKIGNHSDFTVLSFQAIKHLTCGDGGALITRSALDYERAKKLRWYGIDRTYHEGCDLRCEIDVSEAGYKFHMNDINATIGLNNIKHLDNILKRHRENGAFYTQAFSGYSKIKCIPVNEDGQSSYWLYTIHVDNRDELMKKLAEVGIMASKVHARNDTHTMFAAYKRQHLPGLEQFNKTHLCIPVGWWVTDNEREFIAEQVIKFAR